MPSSSIFISILLIQIDLSKHLSQLLLRVYYGVNYELLLEIGIYTLFSIYLFYCFTLTYLRM